VKTLAINFGAVAVFRNAGIESEIPLFSSINYINSILSGGNKGFFFYPPQNHRPQTIPTMIRKGRICSNSVMAQASPAPPSPKMARTAKMIRNVVSIRTSQL
jgi:hypothetical protein